MLWFEYKINSENLGDLTPDPRATTLALSNCNNLYFKIVTILYIARDSHNVALKFHEVAKSLHATMWQKIVTTCSQNSLYVASVTKMWHFCSLLWLVNFFVTNGKLNRRFAMYIL